jgi:hypothetical protein
MDVGGEKWMLLFSLLATSEGRIDVITDRRQQ